MDWNLDGILNLDWVTKCTANDGSFVPVD